MVNVKGDVLSIKDLKRSSASWVSELHSAIESSSSTHKRVYLLSSVIPLEGFTNFLQELRSQPNMDNLRIFINLDKNPNVNLKNIYKKDLVLSILKDGVNNAYLPIPVEFKENVLLNTSTTAVAKNQTVNYIGLNLRDETVNPATEKTQELGNVW